MRGIGAFLRGLFVELYRLALVFGAAIFAGMLVGFGPAGPIALAFGLLFLSLANKYVSDPARVLVQGWLGLLARVQPPGFERRAENLGHALVGLGSVTFLTLPLFANAGRDARPFEHAFLVLAAIVFGPGAALPRLWFAIRAGNAPAGDVLPAMLHEAGERAARIFYYAFMGIGLGLAAAQGAQMVRNARRDTSNDPFLRERRGELCRTATAVCPREQRLDVALPRGGDVQLALYRDPDGSVDEPPCRIALDGAWPADAATRTAMTARLNREPAEPGEPGEPGEPAPEPQATAPTRGGDHVAVQLTLPDGAASCSYWFQLYLPPPAVTP